MDKGYPGFRRLRKSWEYQLVRRMGCKVNTPHFVVLALANTTQTSRLGITVSKKVGHAVQRNRLKRIIREFFRNNRGLYSDSVDYSVIAKPAASLLTSSEIHIELDSAFLKTATTDD